MPDQPNDQDRDHSSSFQSVVIPKEVVETARRTRSRTRSANVSAPAPEAFSWEDAIEAGDYDPHTFFCGSSDDKGSISITVRLPAGIHQIAQQFIQQRTVGNWTTMQDLARDAIVHRLHFAMHTYRTPAALARLLEVERIQSRTAMARELRESQTSAVASVKAELAELTAHGDLDGQRRFLDDAWRSMGALSEPYRTEYRKVLEAYGPAPEWVQAQDWEPGEGQHYLDELHPDA